MTKIKVDFEEVIQKNTAWILRYIKSKLMNKDLAEDILQEVLIKAYRKYDDYEECGKLQPWLMRITQNTIRNYLGSKGNQEDFNISLDLNLEEGTLNLCDILDDKEKLPEEIFEESEAVSEILALVSKLNQMEKQIFNYRVIEGVSIGEVARLTGIPQGTVKSKTHYVLKKIKNELNKSINISKKIRIEGVKMECKAIWRVLFAYAKGILNEKEASIVDEHIKDCKECRSMAQAMKQLIPTLKFALEDEMNHFIINFPTQKISYVGVSNQYTNVVGMNEQLKEWNGQIPEENDWFGCGHGDTVSLLARFDNEGNEVSFVEAIDENLKGHKKVKITVMKKVYEPTNWSYCTFESNEVLINLSEEEPYLYNGHEQNNFGCSVKSAIYHAIPQRAENIRVKRGNGVLDCGTYKFAYVDRYVTEEERIVLDYSYVLR